MFIVSTGCLWSLVQPRKLCRGVKYVIGIFSFDLIGKQKCTNLVTTFPCKLSSPNLTTFCLKYLYFVLAFPGLECLQSSGFHWYWILGGWGLLWLKYFSNILPRLSQANPWLIWAWIPMTRIMQITHSGWTIFCGWPTTGDFHSHLGSTSILCFRCCLFIYILWSMGIQMYSGSCPALHMHCHLLLLSTLPLHSPVLPSLPFVIILQCWISFFLQALALSFLILLKYYENEIYYLWLKAMIQKKRLTLWLKECTMSVIVIKNSPTPGAKMHLAWCSWCGVSHTWWCSHWHTGMVGAFVVWPVGAVLVHSSYPLMLACSSYLLMLVHSSYLSMLVRSSYLSTLVHSS